MRKSIHILVAVALGAFIPPSAHAQNSRRILAVFAHPDDERVIGPLLSKLAREGRETHLVIATDGSQGIRDFAHIPAGPALAAARTKEANCAATRLGVRQLHLLGLPDGGLASFEVLGKLRSRLAAIIDSLKPAVIITFGPEGGTGHPDHRLVGDVIRTLDGMNPQVAARMAGAFESWRRYDLARQGLMRTELKAINGLSGISPNLFEVTGKMLD